MIKIVAVLTLTIMCYLIAEHLTMIYSKPQYFFVWGWMSSITTGFFINWFVRQLND